MSAVVVCWSGGGGVGLEPLCLCLLPDAVTVTGHCVLIVAWVETLGGCEKLT